MKIRRIKKGFTLVELVVVIAVIAILSAVSVGAYFGITDSANHSRAEQEAKSFWIELNAGIIAGRQQTDELTVTATREGWDFSVFSADDIQLMVDSITLTESRHYGYIGTSFPETSNKEASQNNQIYFFASSTDDDGSALVKHFGYIPSNLGGKYVKYVNVITGQIEDPNYTVTLPKLVNVYYANRFFAESYAYVWNKSTNVALGEWKDNKGHNYNGLDGVFEYTLDWTNGADFDHILFHNGCDNSTGTVYVNQTIDIPLTTVEELLEKPYWNGKEWTEFAEINFVNHGIYLVGDKIGSESGWDFTTDHKFVHDENLPKLTLKHTFYAGQNFKLVSESGLKTNADSKNPEWGYENLHSSVKENPNKTISEGSYGNIQIDLAGTYIISLEIVKEGETVYQKFLIEYDLSSYNQNDAELLYVYSNHSEVYMYIWDGANNNNTWPGIKAKKVRDHVFAFNKKDLYLNNKEATKFLLNAGYTVENNPDNSKTANFNVTDYNIYGNMHSLYYTTNNDIYFDSNSCTLPSKDNGWNTNGNAFELGYSNEKGLYYTLTINLTTSNAFKFYHANKWHDLGIIVDGTNYFTRDSDGNIVAKRAGSYTFTFMMYDYKVYYKVN